MTLKTKFYELEQMARLFLLKTNPISARILGLGASAQYSNRTFRWRRTPTVVFLLKRMSYKCEQLRSKLCAETLVLHSLKTKTIYF